MGRGVCHVCQLVRAFGLRGLTLANRLGTTKKNAGSAEAFEKIDREYVINAARAAKAEGTDQRIVYVSVRPSRCSAAVHL